MITREIYINLPKLQTMYENILCFSTTFIHLYIHSVIRFSILFIKSTHVNKYLYMMWLAGGNIVATFVFPFAITRATAMPVMAGASRTNNNNNRKIIY